MVSPISARLLSGTRNDSPLSERLVAANRAASDVSSQSSNGTRNSKSIGNNSAAVIKKRLVSGAIKQHTMTANAASLSGYSGDKEDTSVVPPVYSIDFHDKKTSSPISGRTKDANCPKRQKTIQMNFAATSVQDDLERAGMKYKEFNRDNEEVTAPTGSKDVTIKLKNVALMYSKEVKAPLIASNVSSKSSQHWKNMKSVTA